MRLMLERPRKRGCRGKRKACLINLRHLAWVAALCWGSAWAQTNEEVYREYQFNFSLPGARANGMGGAFIGVADDATASFSNPAGLAFLNETAVTLDFRRRDLDNRVGDIEGNFNTQFEESGATLQNLGFFSLNFRFRSWYFGVFQYNYLDARQDRNSISRSLSGGVERIERRMTLLDLEGTTRGLGIAHRFGRGKLGLTLNHSQLVGRMNYARDGLVRIFGPETVILESNYSSSIDDRHDGWGYSLGFLHETHPRFSFGLVWRDHPTLKLSEEITEIAQEIVDNTFVGQEIFNDKVTIPFVVPDVFGVGARFKARQNLSVLLDWQRIFYSQLIEDGFLIVESIETETRENYQIEDIDEFHLGIEWLIPTAESVWALRTGFFKNPLHAVTYSGNDPAIEDRFTGTRLADEEHLTLGVGWVYRNRFEIDLAANFWGDGNELIASFIWRKK